MSSCQPMKPLVWGWDAPKFSLVETYLFLYLTLHCLSLLVLYLILVEVKCFMGKHTGDWFVYTADGVGWHGEG